MAKTKPVAHKKASRRKGLAAAKLDELIGEATVDAYDESEQTTGFYTMFEEHLALPFKTEVLGVEVSVERIDNVVSSMTSLRSRLDSQPEGWRFESELGSAAFS